jgi:hypothetical protein
MFEVNQGRHLLDTVLLGFDQIINFDKRNILLIAFVVNVFQLGQDQLRLGFIFVICKSMAMIFTR